jgi:hypothetical protein
VEKATERFEEVMKATPEDLNPAVPTVLEESDLRHRTTSEQSFDAYRRMRYDELDRMVASRRPVYLDMNFWIAIRDPKEARHPQKASAFLDVLRSGVRGGQVICPVSYSVFVELLKQKGDRRIRQATLMDELSLGIGLRNPFDVAEIEYLQFFARHTPYLRGRRLYSVWGPIGHIIGELYPEDDEVLPTELMERCRKVILDVMWSTRLVDLIDKDPPANPRGTAFKINIERKNYPRGGKTFERLFAEELDGELDAMSPHLEAMVEQLALCSGVDSGDNGLPPGELRAFINGLREVVTRGLDSTAIPSQRIRAALHAAIRLDDRRPFKDNDIDDIGHASVAAAYCNAFLCDGALGVLLRDAKVRAVTATTCAILSDYDSALDALAR